MISLELEILDWSLFVRTDALRKKNIREHGTTRRSTMHHLKEKEEGQDIPECMAAGLVQLAHEPIVPFVTRSLE